MIEYLVVHYTRKNKHAVAESESSEEALKQPLALQEFLTCAGTYNWDFALSTECVEGGFINPMIETWIFKRGKE